MTLSNCSYVSPSTSVHVRKTAEEGAGTLSQPMPQSPTCSSHSTPDVATPALASSHPCHAPFPVQSTARQALRVPKHPPSPRPHPSRPPFCPLPGAPLLPPLPDDPAAQPAPRARDRDQAHRHQLHRDGRRARGATARQGLRPRADADLLQPRPRSRTPTTSPEPKSKPEPEPSPSPCPFPTSAPGADCGQVFALERPKLEERNEALAKTIADGQTALDDLEAQASPALPQSLANSLFALPLPLPISITPNID